MATELVPPCNGASRQLIKTWPNVTSKCREQLHVVGISRLLDAETVDKKAIRGDVCGQEHCVHREMFVVKTTASITEPWGLQHW